MIQPHGALFTDQIEHSVSTPDSDLAGPPLCRHGLADQKDIQMSDAPDNNSRIFRPDWFRDLLAGRLSLGETFWVGNYGTALFHQPLVVFLAILPVPRLVPAAVVALLVLYQLALTRAVILAQPKVPTPKIWKVVGALVTLGIAALFFSFTRSLISS